MPDQTPRTCHVCQQPATTRDGIVGVDLCDSNTCMTAAYDHAWAANRPDTPTSDVD